MLTVNTEGFVSVLVLCALLSLLMYMLTGNKLSVFIITAGLAPFSFTHEIFAYVSFFALTIVFLFFVFNTRYFVPYIFVFMLALYLYLDNLAAVNGLVEVIYLSGIVLISQFLI